MDLIDTYRMFYSTAAKFTLKYTCVHACSVASPVSNCLRPHGACQTPLFTGFFRQECWSGSPCPSPGDLPDPGIELMPQGSPALAGGFFTTESPGEQNWGQEFVLANISVRVRFCCTLK